MESNRLDNYGKEQQQQNSTRKRKLNELANDGEDDEQLLAEECQEGPQPENCSKRNRQQNEQLDLERIVQLPQEEATGIVTGKQIASPIHHPMKIQLAKETWFDILGFVPRRRLGQIVPQIGDRQFAASIVQPFLHNYGHITLASISISGLGPSHRLIQHGDVPMPNNITDFQFIGLSYLSTSVIDLLEKFQQNSLFRNVNLDLRLQHDALILSKLSHVLPFIDNINSIRVAHLAQLVNFYNSNNELAMAMLEMTRFMAIFFDKFHFELSGIALLNRWLYTPREDGRPRVLILPVDYAPIIVPDRPNQIAQFIDGTIKEFTKTKHPVSFFIRLFVSYNVEWQDSSMENATTKEMLVIKKVESSKFESDLWEQEMAIISRYPMGADRQWIEANEREAVEWNFDEQNGRIHLGNPIAYAIHNEDDSDSDDDDQSDGNGDDDVTGSDSDDQGGNGPNYGDRDNDGDGQGQSRPIRFAKRAVDAQDEEEAEEDESLAVGDDE